LNYLLLNIALALAWAALTSVFTPNNLMIGFVLGYISLFLAQRVLGPSGYFIKVRQVIGFALFFVWELILANLRVAYDVLTPRYHMQPRILAIPLEARTDVEITLLSYFISLTPGTLVLDVSSDRRVLFIHAMYAPDADEMRRKIKQGFEKRLLELIHGIKPSGGQK
jgi:multicomponent Na+:H+ antiporter subunit E